MGCAGAPLGRQYGTLCSALAVAERQRDAGAHTLVVLDDISCMVRRPAAPLWLRCSWTLKAVCMVVWRIGMSHQQVAAL